MFVTCPDPKFLDQAKGGYAYRDLIRESGGPVGFGGAEWNNWTGWTNHVGSISIVNHDMRTGSYCFQILASAGGALVYGINYSIPDTDLYYFYVWYKSANLANSGFSIQVYTQPDNIWHVYDPPYPNPTTYTRLDLASAIRALPGVTGVSALYIVAVTPNYNWYVDDIRLTEKTFYPELNTTADFTDLEGCGNWVFVNERYYNFSLQAQTVNASEHVNYAQINFTLPTNYGVENTTLQNCKVIYTKENSTITANQTSHFTSQYSPGVQKDMEPPLRVRGETVADAIDLNLTVVFQLWFTTACMDVYDPIDAISVYWSLLTDNGFNESGVVEDCFRVYNRGGFTLNTTFGGNSDVGQYSSGPFDVRVGNYSWIEKQIYFKRLQHIKFRPDLYFYSGWQTFYVTYDIRVCIPGQDWIQVLKVEMRPVVQASGSQRWINWTVGWYARNASYGPSPSALLCKTDKFYSYVVGQGGVGQYAQVFYYVDLWFGQENASSVVCGRINAVFYPMMDNAPNWLHILTTGWGIKDDVPKETQFQANLLDYNYDLFHTPQIIMVAVTEKIEVTSDATFDQEVDIQRHAIWDVTEGRQNDRLTGISTPHFDDTIQPTMPNTGLFGLVAVGLARMGQLIADNIVYGGLNLWGMFLGFLDTIAASLGSPGFFTNLSNWLGGAWSGFVNSLAYIGAMITPLFTFLSSFMWKLITIGIELLTYWGRMIVMVFDFLGGGYTAGVNLYNDFGLSQWLTLLAILYPVHLIILWDEHGLEPVLFELNLLKSIAFMLAQGLLWVFQMVLDIAGRIIESIPVVE